MEEGREVTVYDNYYLYQAIDECTRTLVEWDKRRGRENFTLNKHIKYTKDLQRIIQNKLHRKIAEAIHEIEGPVLELTTHNLATLRRTFFATTGLTSQEFEALTKQPFDTFVRRDEYKDLFQFNETDEVQLRLQRTSTQPRTQAITPSTTLTVPISTQSRTQSVTIQGTYQYPVTVTGAYAQMPTIYTSPAQPLYGTVYPYLSSYTPQYQYHNTYGFQAQPSHVYTQPMPPTTHWQGGYYPGNYPYYY